MTLSPDRPQLVLRGFRKRGGVQSAVVVLNGAKLAELRRAAEFAASLSDRGMLVAVDGGLATCVRGNRRPDLYVGDVDSSRKPPAGVPSVIHPQDKDFSDLSAALSELARRKVQVLGIAGLLGGRLDHEWGNLFEAAAHARAFAGILAPTERGTLLVTSHGCRMVTVPGRTVSLFAPGPSAVVSLKGTRWELKRRRLRPGSLGLSNVSGTELELTVHSGTVVLVFVPPKKRRRTNPSS